MHYVGPPAAATRAGRGPGPSATAGPQPDPASRRLLRGGQRTRLATTADAGRATGHNRDRCIVRVAAMRRSTRLLLSVLCLAGAIALPAAELLVVA